MIDYLTICFRNYDLISLQIEHFKKIFNKKDYRLIIVDNTPHNEKRIDSINQWKSTDIVDLVIETGRTDHEFDGVSHGSAINMGVQCCTSDIICIFDSDYFWINKNINQYIISKFEEGYEAVGSSFNCSPDHWHFMKRNPVLFENIPIVYGSYFSKKLANSNSWEITRDEAAACIADESNTFAETGWRIRKHILDNKLKTMNWDIPNNDEVNAYRAQFPYLSFFKNEHNEMMGFHTFTGSVIDHKATLMDTIKTILNKYQ